MVSKNRSKSKVDKQQSKDIAMLKRMIPTQKEVVQTNFAGTLTSGGTIQRLTPLSLDSEKIAIRS